LLWDIGAGSGAIAIEWMRATRGARACAIERDAGRAAMIVENATALGVPRLDIVTGEAPAVLAALDTPDAVFIGGGLTQPELVARSHARLAPGGRIVANAVTIEGETALAAAAARFGGELTRIAVSRAEPIGPYRGWRPFMPVTQWAAIKP
jgi:precorrin-6Y C5,15-methyltransferase (decarboxylating)